MARIDALFVHLLSQRAEALYLSPGQAPCVSDRGTLTKVPGWAPPGAEELASLLREIVPEAGWAELLGRGELGLTYSVEEAGAVRGTLYEEVTGIGASFRPVPGPGRDRVPAPAELPLPGAIASLARARSGLVVVAGPPRAGKSTTLGALLQGIAEAGARHIVTIEDPLRFAYRGGPSLLIQREVGTDTPGPREALRLCLRQDADVVLLDPLRDPALVPDLLLLAEAGALVLVGLGASSCAGAIEYLVSGFPQREQARARVLLGQSLRAVVAQRLCRCAGGQGFVAAHEVLLDGEDLPAVLRAGGTRAITAYLLGGRLRGMQTMAEALRAHVEAGVITEHEAQRCAGVSGRPPTR